MLVTHIFANEAVVGGVGFTMVGILFTCNTGHTHG